MKKCTMKSKEQFCILGGLLVIVWCAAILLIVPQEGVYGSTIDWLSQHVPLAETIRDACISQKTLLPAFLPLGGTSNGFDFSYYGFLRPDILVGILLPKVSMSVILTAYMLLGYLASVLLFYRFLYLEVKDTKIAFWGSMLFLFAACFFHTHRQVMFINYMPFLLAALLSVQKRQYKKTIVFLMLVFCNSFYFSISALVAVGWYWYGKEGFSFWKNYLKTAVFSCGIMTILFLPTLLSILENHRDGTKVSQIPWLLPKMNFLLYSPYGMGLTACCLYFLLCGLVLKNTRKNSLFYLICSSCGIVAWILNGTLYARGKILIPFVPLVLLHCVQVIRAYQKEDKPLLLWPFACLTACLCFYHTNQHFGLYCMDILLLFLAVIVQNMGKTNRWKTVSFCVLLIMPGILCVQTGKTESFVSKTQMAQLEYDMNHSLPQKNMYRSENLATPLATANIGSNASSSMYSSVTNPAYADFYYKTLMTPIQINNRIALLPEENPFLLQFMGVRYVKTTASKLPFGYQAVKTEDGMLLAENPNVLPIAYLVDDVISEKVLASETKMQQLETLFTNTVAETSEEGAVKRAKKSYIKEFQPEFFVCHADETIAFLKDAAGNYKINASETANIDLQMTPALKDEILFLQFDVKNHGNSGVVISVNDIKNKLSGKNAAYPNQNHRFSYQLLEEDGLSKLHMTFSAGHYTLENVRCYRCPSSLLYQKQYKTVTPTAVSGNEIFSCKTELTENGYFVTSIPMQNGLQIFVDGKKVPILKMNTAFVGAALEKGNHTVSVRFTPPGFLAGYLISILMAAFLIYPLFIAEKRPVALSDSI